MVYREYQSSCMGLTNYWLSAASLWRQHQAPTPTTLSENYRQPLAEIIKDASPIGGLGKSILTSHLTFLLAVDKEVDPKQLLPIFDLDSPDFQAAWMALLQRDAFHHLSRRH